MTEPQTLPAGRGAAAFVRRGQTIKIINTPGTQVIDTWAFPAREAKMSKDGQHTITSSQWHPSVAEHMSMSHTRTSTCHLSPRLNDMLVSNYREPLLKMVGDSSPGNHDTLIASCDPKRYELLGVDNWQSHGSCAENLVAALAAYNEQNSFRGDHIIGRGISVDSVPAPLNLFMNIPWNSEGTLSFERSTAKPNDYVRLEAVQDVLVVLSACPMDINAINGYGPRNVHFLVED